MADLYEYYNTGRTDTTGFYGTEWRAQTFTPLVAHKITSVKLQLYRAGLPGEVTVGIRATNVSGHPTGGDLCFGTIDGDTLTESTNGAWYEITLGAGYNLDADTKYAIVVRAISGDGDNNLQWGQDDSSPTYTRGNFEYSNNSGGSWAATLTRDFLFEDWGEPLITKSRAVSANMAAKMIAGKLI